MVVEPKMAQPVESNDEPVDLFNLTGQGMQKPSLSSRMLVQSIENWSRGGWGPTITCQILNAND